MFPCHQLTENLNTLSLFKARIGCSNFTVKDCDFPCLGENYVEEFSSPNIENCQWFCLQLYKNVCTDFVYDNVARTCRLYSCSFDSTNTSGCKIVSGDVGPNAARLDHCIPFFEENANSCSVSSASNYIIDQILNHISFFNTPNTLYIKFDHTYYRVSDKLTVYSVAIF